MFHHGGVERHHQLGQGDAHQRQPPPAAASGPVRAIRPPEGAGADDPEDGMVSRVWERPEGAGDGRHAPVSLDIGLDEGSAVPGGHLGGGHLLSGASVA
jgi:hypothetical protein